MSEAETKFWKIGDVVILKSFGAPMTITKVDRQRIGGPPEDIPTRYHTIWMDQAGHIQTNVFPHEILRELPPGAFRPSEEVPLPPGMH